MKTGTKVDIAFEPCINDFRGIRSVQLLLKDVRAARRFDDTTLLLAKKFLSESSAADGKGHPAAGQVRLRQVWNHITRRARTFRAYARSSCRTWPSTRGRRPSGGFIYA
jgi:hypothetical protein